MRDVTATIRLDVLQDRFLQENKIEWTRVDLLTDTVFVNSPLWNSHSKIILTMPPQSSNSKWKSGDDAKLLRLVKQGLVDPSDRSIATIKLLHKEWPQKSYKSFAQLIRGKLEKIHLAQNIEGARRVRAQLDQQQGKLLLCWCCIFELLKVVSFSYSSIKPRQWRGRRGFILLSRSWGRQRR